MCGMLVYNIEAVTILDQPVGFKDQMCIRDSAGGDRSAGWDDLSGASAVFQYTCQTQISEDADDRGKPYQ